MKKNATCTVWRLIPFETGAKQMWNTAVLIAFDSRFESTQMTTQGLKSKINYHLNSTWGGEIGPLCLKGGLKQKWNKTKSLK